MRRRLGMFGGVRTGSGGGVEGNMVADGISGKSGWHRTAVGGIVLWMLGIRKGGRGDENEKSKGAR